jgi:AbrB family looped-hinge helix DNA binding protein
MDKVKVKIDSKGRMHIPAKIRQELGDTITIKKTPEGYLLTSKQYVANESSEN